MAESRIKKIFIFVGEPSGDLHGSYLVKALKASLPGFSFEGVAGPRLRAEGVTGDLVMEDFEVMGLTDVLLSLPKLVRHFYRIRNHIVSTNPSAVILVDYPGFNLRMAKALRKKGYKGKIIQYISPTVWAWGKHRIDEMAKTLDLLLTIYPFESTCFDDTSVSRLNHRYIGNPLCEYLKEYRYDQTWLEKSGIPNAANLIAIFPGSRKGEIVRNLPLLLAAAALYKEKHPEALFALSCTQNSVQEYLQEHPLQPILQNSLFFVPKEYTYELMRNCRTAIAKSGTVTLELALHLRPTVVIYKLTLLNRLYAKHLLKLNLPHYCIVNILGGKEVFPELIEKGLSPANLHQLLEELNADGEKRTACIHQCNEIHKALGINNASHKAAEAITQIL